MIVFDEFVFFKSDGKTALFFDWADRAFIRHKPAVFYAQMFYQSAPLLLIQVGKEYDRLEKELAGTSDQFLETEFPHTKLSMLQIQIMLFNKLHLFQHDLHDG